MDALKDEIYALNNRMDALTKELHISLNSQRVTGEDIPYKEIQSIDGSFPNQANGARSALPPIHNIMDLHNLTPAELAHYLHGHGLSEDPAATSRDILARAIGCTVFRA
ncbi:hypothetical protein BDP27DRAFT_1072289 [Rhodocollybia butyracea]|uniref:Mug135-like C-terminal domain-containing protein n=1 Tax=Rhodocollybia butyracea TaxID=206335 RepID=A0A9P5U5J5_9AGAR|nr:hypothetical protein BDP27DRAFT_1072289 [Rhodocollybia butyracea]